MLTLFQCEFIFIMIKWDRGSSEPLEVQIWSVTSSKSRQVDLRLDDFSTRGNTPCMDTGVPVPCKLTSRFIFLLIVQFQHLFQFLHTSRTRFRVVRRALDIQYLVIEIDFLNLAAVFLTYFCYNLNYLKLIRE